MAKRIVNINIEIDITDDDARILDGYDDDTYWDHIDIISSAFRNRSATILDGALDVYDENGTHIREWRA